MNEFCDLQSFGPLQLKIMRVVWQQEEGGESTTTVQDCLDKIRTDGKPPAYTTIMTVVYRLREKGWLKPVKKVGHTIHYRSTLSRQEIGQQLLRWVVSEFYDNDPTKLLLADEESEDERKLAVVAMDSRSNL